MTYLELLGIPTLGIHAVHGGIEKPIELGRIRTVQRLVDVFIRLVL